ncbi:myb domain-containing protein [Tieghemostelium lacteum]|uniref:Myb domain-containing protein n=1 Tax=Tieghemostelium lacteum TaxID=361077 RepID=A0A152A641_TIELA|nr:myb domain-containing protein [Tieghemostelium lacteum]|eukprot:KYR01690.1 myb domain-containing protein [Tieghemostelium lacteum]
MSLLDDEEVNNPLVITKKNKPIINNNQKDDNENSDYSDKSENTGKNIEENENVEKDNRAQSDENESDEDDIHNILHDLSKKRKLESNTSENSVLLEEDDDIAPVKKKYKAPRDKDLENDDTSIYDDDNDDDDDDNILDFEFDIDNNNNNDNVNKKKSTTTTSTNTNKDSGSSKKGKEFQPNIRKKAAKPKAKSKDVEERYDEISPLEVGNFTLAQLTKKRITGQPMQATIEREKLKSVQRTQLQNQLVQQQQRAQINNSNDNDSGVGASVEFVDGKMVMKQHILGDESQLPQDYTVFYEGQNHVTNRTYSKKPAARKWTKEETEHFHILLRTYGTDFSTLESLLPDRTRSQIRSKFKKEERENPNLLEDLINTKIDINMEDFNKQSEEAKKKRKFKEDNIKQHKDMLDTLDPNATESELNELSEQISTEKQSAFFNSLQKANNNQQYQEEVVMDQEQYNQQQQESQLQQQSDYDYLNFQNDDYGTGDYDY